MRLAVLLCCSLLFLYACNRGASNQDYPRPVDTQTVPIELQEKRTYEFPTADLRFDNEFDGARLNDLERITDSFYVVSITPENEPINPSPWYAFRIRAERDQRIRVRISYPNGARHRYFPKLSTDRKNWSPIDSAALIRNLGSSELTLILEVRAGEPLYVAGQEVINSADVGEWIEGLAVNPRIRTRVIGQSKLGRDIPHFSLGTGPLDDRPTIVLLSRQHPPEVTGFLAFRGFIAGLLEDPRLEEFLDQYQVLVYPLLNPDGVDLGHWRHTAGGIDSNRDWARYRQPEARQVADDVVRTVREAGSKVVLGIDFHSTYRDVYYTHLDDVQPPTALPGFKDAWLAAVERGIGGDFRINEEAEPIGRPTTMSWFRKQFGAEGITYEIGDNTDRDFVERKGRVSAAALIEVFLVR
ncbi:MAG: M14 family metallopeptidase [Bacteroidota bacterium]